MRDIGIIYLCRFAEGEEPVRSFLASYRAHEAGVDHDLHVVFKGFPDRASLDRFRALFDGLVINVIELDDSGFDLGAYVRAARAVTNRRVIFLNTFSRILADNWLRYFDNAMNEPGVGVAGATGSWQSNAASYERILKRLIQRLWGWSEKDKPNAGTVAQLPLSIALQPRPAFRYLFAPFYYLYLIYQYGRHPNPHLRTNAIMVDRAQFLSLRLPDFRTKNDAYRVESGRLSLTRQYMAKGFKPVVIDRNGVSHAIEQWYASSTFWSGGQANLLIGDKRTRAYDAGTPEMRTYLEHSAWLDPWTGR